MPLSNRQQSGQTQATIGNQVGVRANRKREVLSARRVAGSRTFIPAPPLSPAPLGQRPWKPCDWR